MDPNISDDKFIDLDDVIRKKNPQLFNAIPRFLISYLKKIVHQDGLNDIIRKHKNEYGLDFVRGSLHELGTTYTAYGTHNIPKSGRFIFAGNHPLGGLDGLILIDAVGKHFPDVKFLANDLLLNVTNLEAVFVPVNKHGRQSAAYAHMIEDAYKSDSQLLSFPAGLCSRKVDGKITDPVWQKSFIVKSIAYKRDIIPVYFEARNSNFFYNLARLRKFFKIKMNFEMLYLPDEMYKQKKRKISITFGKPIPYTLFDKSRSPMEWALYVRNIAYALKDQEHLKT